VKKLEDKVDHLTNMLAKVLMQHDEKIKEFKAPTLLG
jgi:hypothetical protein